jgi:CspA family cold shock protein
MATGTVKWFSPGKGYGFITQDDSGKSLFAHFSQINAIGLTELKEGQRVAFEVVERSRYREAENIVVIN